MYLPQSSVIERHSRITFKITLIKIFTDFHFKHGLIEAFALGRDMERYFWFSGGETAALHLQEVRKHKNVIEINFNFSSELRNTAFALVIF